MEVMEVFVNQKLRQRQRPLIFLQVDVGQRFMDSRKG